MYTINVDVNANYVKDTSETEEKPEELTSLEVKDSTIYVGDEWTAEDNFVSAKDKDGNDVAFSDIIVDGTVDASKAGEYKVVYKNGNVEQTATTTVAQNPNAPVENPDGSISFVGQEWDVIKDYGDGTKMIAMQDEITESIFTEGNYFFKTNEDTLDGDQDSLVKPIVDGWYNDTISGQAYEQFVQPVSLPNPTLGKMKELGWESNEDGFMELDVWNLEINEPAKYPTLVGGEESMKQAFLMSGADVTSDAQGNLSQAALTHRDKLASNGMGSSWLRSPGDYGNRAAILFAHTDYVVNNYVYNTYSVVPSLVVHVPTCG
ncbi:hypothetical protein EG888_14750 [Listeria monocytogenes]|uniref:Ig-like domain-containing protein n=1 Tax=Listeria monocytogenes TaxID=1639 RepID=A0A9P3QX09_LISMN|nr:hypothetical protein [Listeria monocytogenes]EAD5037730.1 hypothetical protein [Listeria monocytogenes serotype 1/2a]EAC2419050.1 hypothetical protein [Listeria monocytogenes]EAC2697489.1 hypothetical protein [Listeria monocytogenes]EAC3244944.1 hypothetical protein [Listeria monocytogenes]